MPARIAVLFGPRTRTGGVPSRAQAWLLRSGVRDFHPRPGPMFGVLADVLSRVVPEQRDLLHPSFTLADTKRLEHMFAGAGFREVRVARVQREDTIGSFDEYWDPIETGVGSQPQVYVALSQTDRRAVREEVKSRLSPFSPDGRLVMSVEMLIAVGRA